MTNDGPLARAQREWMRQSSISQMYQEPQAPRARPQLYTESTYQGLADARYQNRAEPIDNRSASAKAYTAANSPWERAARAAAEEVAEADWQAHREAIAGSGHDAGIFGNSTPVERATALGSRGFGSGRQVEHQGHLTSQAQATPGQPSLSMLSRLPRQDGPVTPQRENVTQLSSSGTGWSQVMALQEDVHDPGSATVGLASSTTSNLPALNVSAEGDPTKDAPRTRHAVRDVQGRFKPRGSRLVGPLGPPGGAGPGGVDTVTGRWIPGVRNGAQLQDLERVHEISANAAPYRSFDALQALQDQSDGIADAAIVSSAVRQHARDCANRANITFAKARP